MTFKTIPSAVSIANRALGMVSEGKTITSLDENGLNAEAVRRWYVPIVAHLLETHHWGLATKRASLVQVDNGRSSEWLYAYAVPDDMAFPVGISLENGSSTVSYYRGLSGLIAMLYGRPIFQFHNNVLYSNLQGELEYVSFDITEANFTATFANIIVLMLASRLALELPKDFDLSKELDDNATYQINLAITQNLNYGNRQYGQTVSETELVRGSLYGPSWDYFPRAPGS
jgi:hypothetical protein